METEWILDEIATGLQKLYLLCLERTPSADLLAGTAHAWLESITDGNRFEQGRDTPRIRAAFRTLARERESWPAPKHLMEALPRVEQAALGYEVKPATREEAERAMARIRELLDEPVPDFSVPEPVKREGPSLAKVEEDLQAHYGRAPSGPDRKSRAVGPDA